VQLPACTSDDDCFETQFCNFVEDSCGDLVDDTGTCDPRPRVCDLQLDRVCGCDGMVYDNQCEAAARGTDLDEKHGCAVPSTEFACGSRTCNRVDQICVEFVSNSQGSQFACQQFPPECRTNRNCTCLPQFGCSVCTEVDDTFTLMCSGPAEDSLLRQ
jgi:hypothetical protein